MAVRRCGCTQTPLGNQAGAKFQDKEYGPGMRLYTEGPKGQNGKIRCTVCGKVIDVRTGGGEPKEAASGSQKDGTQTDAPAAKPKKKG